MFSPIKPKIFSMTNIELSELQRSIKQMLMREKGTAITVDEIRTAFAEMKMFGWHVDSSFTNLYEAEFGLYCDPHSLYSEYGDCILTIAAPFADDTESICLLIVAYWPEGNRGIRDGKGAKIKEFGTIQQMEDYVNSVWEDHCKRVPE